MTASSSHLFREWRHIHTIRSVRRIAETRSKDVAISGYVLEFWSFQWTTFRERVPRPRLQARPRSAFDATQYNTRAFIIQGTPSLPAKCFLRVTDSKLVLRRSLPSSALIVSNLLQWYILKCPNTCIIKNNSKFQMQSQYAVVISLSKFSESVSLEISWELLQINSLNQYT